MLSRALRRTLLDPKYSIPPTFLLPWTAGFSTASTSLSAPSFATPQSAIENSPVVAYTSSPASISHDENSILATRAALAPLQLSHSVRELLPILRAQGKIYVNAHIFGRSYLLTEGDTVRLPFVMKDASIGDTIRLNRAIYLGSRDLTLKAASALPGLRSDATPITSLQVEIDEKPGKDLLQKERVAPHFVPNIMKDKYSYIDERLFVCRAAVIGVESEPMRIMEKTKRRQRHVKHVRSKHRYTILKISELKLRTLEELDAGRFD